MGVIHFRNFLPANFLDRFLQHLDVQVKADRIHLSRLFCTEQVSHPANFHVAHSELIARAELSKFLNGAQPLTGSVGQLGAFGVEQPSVCLNSGSADSSSQLIQLGQAEPLRIFDQNRVDAGNIQPRFNDGGAEQNFGFALAKGEHGRF